MNTFRLTVALACLAFTATGRADSRNPSSSLRRLPTIEGVQFISTPLILVDAEDAPLPPPDLALPQPAVQSEESVMPQAAIVLDPAGPFSPYRGLGFMGSCCEIPNPCAAGLWKGFHPHVCEHPCLFDHLHGWLHSRHGHCKGCEEPGDCDTKACGPKTCLFHKHLPKLDCCFPKFHGCEIPCGKTAECESLPMQKGFAGHCDHKPLRHRKRHGCEACDAKGYSLPGEYQTFPTEAVPQPGSPAADAENELNPPAPPVPTTARPRTMLDFSDMVPPVFPGDKSA